MKGWGSIEMVYVLAFFNILNSFVIFDFMNRMYKKKYSNRKVYLIAYLLLYLIHLSVNIYHVFLVNILFEIIFVQAVGRILYKDTSRKIVYNLLFALYMIFMDSLSFAIVSLVIVKPLIQLLPGAYYVGIALVLNYTMIFSTYKLLIKRFFKRNIDEIRVRKAPFFAFLTTFQLGIIFSLWHLNIEEASMLLMLMSIGFILIDMYLIFLFEIVYEHKAIKYEMNLAQQQANIFKNNINDMQNKYEQSRKLIHDMRGLLRVSEELYMVGNFAVADNLKSQVEKSLNKLEGRYHCDNIVMNVIINDRLSTALSKGIKMNISIQNDIDWSFFKEMHMATLFLNLLNNAIEACEQMEDGLKYIDLRIGKINENIIINMKNSYMPKFLKIKNKKYVSSKPGHFGIGLGNINKVVEKYNGVVKIKPESSEFTVEIFLSMFPQEEEIDFD